MHVLNCAVVSALGLHVYRFCKRLPAKNETLPFTTRNHFTFVIMVIISVIFSPQLPDKSIASLVKYYYSWKKTRSRTSLMDKQAKKLYKTGDR